ncbi:MAG TPA: phosphate ABC transporter permease subunit PstC [Cytophagaceae bacterium]
MQSTRYIKNYFSDGWMGVAVTLLLLLPLVILTGLLLKSIPVLQLLGLGELLISSDWLPGNGQFGFLPFILSSVYVSLIGLIIMIPLGLFPAIYLTQFAKPGFLSVMRSVIDVLAGIPSVIHGVWGVLIVVPFVGNYVGPLFGKDSGGYTILAGGIVLAVSVIPFVLNMLLEVFRSIPLELKEASLSLGTTYWETVKKVILKKAMPGIVAAYALGLSKAFGETIAVLMVVGNVAQIPTGVFDAGYPLPALIANNYGEMLSIPMYDSALMFAALLLFAVVLVFNMIARLVISKTEVK